MTRLTNRLLIGFVVLAATFGTGVWLGFGAPGLMRPLRPDTPVILKEVQALSELATVKYVMEKVVTHEIEKVFGRDKILLVAHGVVKAGIDFGTMVPDDLRISGKDISIHLPRSQVTDSYLDEKQTFVYDRGTGLFVRPENNLESEARRMALTAMLTAAHGAGIHREADERARALVTGLCRQLGYERVEFR